MITVVTRSDGSCCCVPPQGYSGIFTPKVQVACCPNPLSLVLKATLFVDPAVNPGICAPCSGGVTVPLTWRPGSLDWFSGPVAICDELLFTVGLSCVVDTWRWFFDVPFFSGGGGIVDQVLNCNPLLLVAFGGFVSPNCLLLRTVFTE